MLKRFRHWGLGFTKRPRFKRPAFFPTVLWVAQGLLVVLSLVSGFVVV